MLRTVSVATVVLAIAWIPGESVCTLAPALLQPPNYLSPRCTGAKVLDETVELKMPALANMSRPALLAPLVGAWQSADDLQSAARSLVCDLKRSELDVCAAEASVVEF